jgi:hypothetical protein
MCNVSICLYLSLSVTLLAQVQRSQQVIRSVTGNAPSAPAVHYSSFYDALVKTYRGEGGAAGSSGLRALYRGAMARVSPHPLPSLLCAAFALCCDAATLPITTTRIYNISTSLPTSHYTFCSSCLLSRG